MSQVMTHIHQLMIDTNIHQQKLDNQSQIFEEEEDLRDSALVRDFFCIDNPPTLRTESFDRVCVQTFDVMALDVS